MNKDGEVRLIYMGLRCAENSARVLKHTWWLIKRGGGPSLDMNSRLRYVMERNRKRESTFQRKRENNKLRPVIPQSHAGSKKLTQPNSILA